MIGPSRIGSLLFAAGCVCLLALAPAPAAAQSPSLTPVGGTFSAPVYTTAPPGDGRRLMVVEQGGTVRVIRDGVTLTDPFLTVTADFTTGGERGLLGLAFSPDYEQSRLLYVYFTDAEGDIRVDELRRAEDSRDRVEPEYRRPVIEIPHREAGNHNGGTVAFGPDGRLYIGTGDGGNGYDQPVRDARDRTSLLGKLLRIAPTPGGGYTIPVDNPFAGPAEPGRDEVWSYGLRNPFRFSFDSLTGDLFIGDVGQNTIEEVNHAPFATGGAGRGANFGWDDCEGNLAAEPSTGTAPCELVGDQRPAISLPHASRYCSVIGGVVVRDASVAQLAGRYLYGDLCQARLRSYVSGAPETDREEPTLAVRQLAGIGEDACGRVHVVQLGGAVSRLDGGSPGDCALRVPEPGGGGAPAGAGPPGGASVIGGATGSGRSPIAAPVTLRLRLGGPRRQRLTRRGLLVRARCSEPCRLRALGALNVRRGERQIRLPVPARVRQVHRRLLAGRPAALRLKVSGASRAVVRRALARGRRVLAAVTVRVRDARGNLRRARRTIRLRL